MPTVLLVDDDEQIRKIVRSILAADGYRLVEATTGAEAVDRGRELGAELRVLLSDMLLPELSGYDVAATLRESNPELPVIFMTGYVEGEIVQRCVSELGASFLDKPFPPGLLRQAVRDAMGRASAASDQR